jgi:hypothetical protein
LYKSVKVSENDLARDFLLLNLIYTGFEVSPEPPFEDREFGFDREAFTIPDKVKIVGHLLSIFSPDILGALMDPSGNNRIRMESFTNIPVHFLGIISPVHDITLRRSCFMKFLQKYECVF